MEFRWVAAIALWTLLCGPVFHHPWPSSITPDEDQAQAAVRR
jgi:hypothetical protein